MSTVLRPAGPEPAQVYWTRRLLVLGGLILVVVLIWSVLSGLGGGDGNGEAEGATQDDAAADGATQDEPATDTPAARTCTAEDLTLIVTTDTRAYPAGSQPVFTVTITNTSDSSCAVDAGEASRELLVTSGVDRIWSSLDCAAADAAERVLLLPAGGSDDPVSVTWPRIRSAEGCTTGLPEPRAPGTYRVVAKLVGAASEPAVFDLG